LSVFFFHRVGKKDFHASLLVSGNDVKAEAGVDGSKSVGLVVCKNCITKHNEAGVMFDGVDVKRERNVPKVLFISTLLATVHIRVV